MIQTFIIFIATAVIAALISVTVACHQVTRTLDVFHFVCDYNYWCFAVINYRYRRAKDAGISDEDFAKAFVRDYLQGGHFRRLHPMPSSIRVLILRLLANFDFVNNNLGIERYSYGIHTKVLADFEIILNSKA